jgi:hypothetical protein
MSPLKQLAGSARMVDQDGRGALWMRGQRFHEGPARWMERETIMRLLIGGLILLLLAPVLLLVAVIGMPLLIVAAVLLGVPVLVGLALLGAPLLVLGALAIAVVVAAVALIASLIGAAVSVVFSLLKLAIAVALIALVGYGIVKLFSGRPAAEAW